MDKRIIRIQKISLGIAQLFTAMDKGFARVESDLVLLRKFRHICFDANESITNSLKELQRNIESNPEFYNKENIQNRKELLKQLRELQEKIDDSVFLISDYIEEFSNFWKTSFSLNALIKFKYLILNELNLLEKEIEALEMEHLHTSRKSILKNTFRKSETARTKS